MATGAVKHFQLVDFFGSGDAGKSAIGAALSCGFQFGDVWNKERKLCKEKNREQIESIEKC